MKYCIVDCLPAEEKRQQLMNISHINRPKMISEGDELYSLNLRKVASIKICIANTSGHTIRNVYLSMS